MKERLIAILERFCPGEVYQQGTLAEDEPYPAKFITFFTTTSVFDTWYDDDPNTINWSISVMFYSTDPAEVASEPPLIIAALRADGFIPKSAGIDIMCDVQTHTGWAMDFVLPEHITT